MENVEENEEKTVKNEKAFTFRNPLKLFRGQPKWKFLPRKKNKITPGKIGKSDFAPPEKFPCYAPVRNISYLSPMGYNF